MVFCSMAMKKQSQQGELQTAEHSKNLSMKVSSVGFVRSAMLNDARTANDGRNMKILKNQYLHIIAIALNIVCGTALPL